MDHTAIRAGQKPQRVVVKVGTTTVCHPDGAPNLRNLESLCRTLADLSHTGWKPVLVTSGAIGVGTQKLGLKQRPDTVSGRQAAAAIGQCELMSVYDRFFQEYGMKSGQLLLTKNVTEDPSAKANVTATFNELLEMNVVPIVNENDSVATEEIVYGDNDTLSAVVASLVQADLLIILSDIDGLYDRDPRLDPNAKLIPVMTDLEKAGHLAGGAHSLFGTGGMATKVHAARIARQAGIPTIVASGARMQILYDIADGKSVGTLFALEAKS